LKLEEIKYCFYYLSQGDKNKSSGAKKGS